MTSREIEGRCVACGASIPGYGARAVRCADCFETFLRGVDAAFLDNLSRFGIRSRQVVAETCLRALVLANADDRKLLGMTIYEQFIQSAADLIALHGALRRRHLRPISESVLDFRLDAASARAFFAELSTVGATGMLAAVDLPSPALMPPLREFNAKDRKGVERSLHEAVLDFERVIGFQELGERALAVASEHMRGRTALTDRTQWLANRAIGPNQVASIALDAEAGRLDIAALRIDEERLELVIDGIDVFTRLSRNLIHAFLMLNDPALFENGFRRTAPRSRTTG